MRFIALWLLLCSTGNGLLAQTGCTDSLALNYQPEAKINDGSCMYAHQKISLLRKGKLPSDVKETSGLIFYRGELWTINDSGDGPLMYQTDTATGAIIRKVFIKNASNIDWEAVTSDEKYVYVGDFGNNITGNRDDLTIYRVDFSLLKPSGDDTLNADIIRFEYSDWERSSSSKKIKVNSTRYDCEAFVAYADSLHLFTKDWKTYHTRHYVLPAKPGYHKAEFVEEFNVNALVTDAAISPEGVLAFTAYSKNFRKALIWLFSDYRDNLFFSGNKRRLEAGKTIRITGRKKAIGQIEAICFTHSMEGFTTSEGIDQKAAGINIKTVPLWHEFNFKGLISVPVYGEMKISFQEDSVCVTWYPIKAEDVQHVWIQKSFNGKVFTDIASIRNVHQSATRSFLKEENAAYRLKIIRKSGGVVFIYPKY